MPDCIIIMTTVFFCKSIMYRSWVILHLDFARKIGNEYSDLLKHTNTPENTACEAKIEFVQFS